MAQVQKYKDHQAVLSWYLIDEPDGDDGGDIYPPEYVKEAAALIRSLDRSHPISACFDTTNRADGPWRAVPGGAVPEEFASGRRQSHHRTHRSSQRCRSHSRHLAACERVGPIARDEGGRW